MNKRGQTIMLSILFAVMIFIVGMTIVNFFKDDITDARTSLNCSAPTLISDGTKLTCLAIDGVVPYFIVLIFSMAGGIILDRLLI